MPLKPPKQWFEECVESTKSIADEPKRLCGWIWHHHMKAKTKQKMLEKYER